MLAPPQMVRKTAWTRKSQLWKFAQIMFLKVLEKRESGSWELKLSTTKLTKEQWLWATTTMEDQSVILKLKTGPLDIQRTWDLIQLGKMTGMTQLNILIHIDMITRTSPNKNIKMFSVELLEMLFKKKLITTRSISSRESQLLWLSIKLNSARHHLSLLFPRLIIWTVKKNESWDDKWKNMYLSTY